MGVGACGIVEHAVPDVFDEDVNPELGGEGEGFLDSDEGAIPGFPGGGSFANDAGNEENGRSADGVGLLDTGEEALQGFGAFFFVRRGELGVPVDGVDDPVNRKAGRLGSGEGFGGVGAHGGVSFDAIIAEVFEELVFLGEGVPLADHAIFDGKVEGPVRDGFGFFMVVGEKGSGGSSSGDEEGSTVHLGGTLSEKRGFIN